MALPLPLLGWQWPLSWWTWEARIVAGGCATLLAGLVLPRLLGMSPSSPGALPRGPRLFSGLTCSGKLWTPDVKGKRLLGPHCAPTCTTGFSVTAPLARPGTMAQKLVLGGGSQGFGTLGEGGVSRKPEPTCGHGRAVPSCSLPVVTPACGSVSSPSLEWLPLLAPPFAWELLHLKCWGTQHPQPPAHSSCSLPPSPCLSWLEGHACPLAWILFQGVPDPGEGSAPSCLDESGDFDVLRTRHSRHARKRRRLV